MIGGVRGAHHPKHSAWRKAHSVKAGQSGQSFNAMRYALCAMPFESATEIKCLHQHDLDGIFEMTIGAIGAILAAI